METRIYSTLSEDIIDLNNNNEEVETAILNYLCANEDKTIKVKDISKACGLSTSGTCVQTRFHIARLVQIKKQPIVSNQKGFCYTHDVNKIRHNIESNNERIQGIMRRNKALIQIMEGKQ